tara:strand:- start:626 stop:787 length:162 start_codon:yes stop_codon:yes gene_type:complete
MDNIDEILFNMKSVFARALVPVTIITFCGICALAPLYVTLGIMQRQVINTNNN